MRSSSLHQSLVSTKLIEREKAAVKLKCKFYANIDLDFSFDSLFSSLVEREIERAVSFSLSILNRLIWFETKCAVGELTNTTLNT